MRRDGDLSSTSVGEVRLRVRYAETDQMALVYHSHYFIWMEIGRVEFIRQLGFDYKRMEYEDDCHLPVVDARCRYRLPARYDDQVLIRTELRNVRGSLIHFGYEILREHDRAVLAEGETTHLLVNSRMEKRSLPDRYRAAFEVVTRRQA